MKSLPSMWSLWALLLWLLSGCAPSLPAPQLDSVDPAWGYNGEDTDIVITGQDFFPRVRISGTEDFEVDRQFRVWLEGAEDTELQGVAAVSYTTIDANVPAGLEPGVYDLSLSAPNGARASLAQAFTVTDSRADHLSSSLDKVGHAVYALAQVSVQLQDPEDRDVAMPLDVTVQVYGANDGGEHVRFESTLTDQQPIDIGVGIQGTLDAAGHGAIILTSEVPDDLWVDISPSDPDSIVANTTESLMFTAGDATQISLSLPNASYTPRVGTPFDLQLSLLDAWGNPTSGVIAAVGLWEQCGDPDTRFQDTLSFADQTTLTDVVLTGATTDGCAENSIEAVGTAYGAGIEGSTGGFQVSPGAVDALQVEAGPSLVTAGETSVAVWVRAVDAWGNRVPDYDEPLSLSDTAGGLEPDAGIGTASCGAFLDGEAFCAAQLWQASDADQLVVMGADGVAGTSNSLSVQAGTPTQVLLSVSGTEQVAGEAVDTYLRVTDLFGNPVELDVTGDDEPTFTDDGDRVSCTWIDSAEPTGSEHFSCVFTVAGSARSLSASIDSLGLIGSSDEFAVVNGALYQVDVQLGGVTSLTAGDSLDLQLSATDAWGNPYKVQATSTVDLADASGDLSDTATLDSDGESTLTAYFTTAWVADAVTASVGGVSYGASANFDVVAGAHAGFSVVPDQTWAWLDDPLEVSITAVDSYGNTVTGYSDSADLSSHEHLGDDVEVSTFSAGVANAEFLFDTPGLADVLQVADATTSGTSVPVDAVDADCSAPPSADLTISGSDELVLCLTSGSTPSTTMDASGSTAGDAALTTWHFSSGDGDWTRLSTDSTTASWTDAAAYTAQVLVVDADACADLAIAQAWVAESDGEPAGPVGVTVRDDTLIAGSSTDGVTVVDLLATDCAGDPSSGGTLWVRADLGDISSSGSSVTSTGAGLALSLDSAGEASVTWSMASETQAGTPSVHAGVLTGAAYGSDTATVTGDASPPTVLTVNPRGTTIETFESIEVIFSEPMLVPSINTTSAAVTDPDGSAVTLDSVSLSSDNQTATLVLPQVGDAGAGAWTVAFSSRARDASGNRLDGRYTGSSNAFALQFGDVTNSAPDLLSCTATVSLFRPDGDDGAGEEADAINISVVADGTPEWWRLDITDADGETVMVSRVAASSSSTTLSWDGRDQDGAIMDNGEYGWRVVAEDEYWNEGAGCTDTVQIDNLVRSPE